MDKPKFFMQKCDSKYPGYVALMAQFLPTFDAQEPKETAGAPQEVLYQDDGEEIEEADVNEKIEEGESQYCFYFLCDRSGSMMGGKNNITRESMKLFLQSLPNG